MGVKNKLVYRVIKEKRGEFPVCWCAYMSYRSVNSLGIFCDLARYVFGKISRVFYVSRVRISFIGGGKQTPKFGYCFYFTVSLEISLGLKPHYTGVKL